jgi:hypothetical protein
MAIKNPLSIECSADLIEAIRSFPVEREIEHCGTRVTISPFEFYAQCPHCGTRIKVRSFSASTEIEDIFDAVFAWMKNPKAQQVAKDRQKALADEEDE